MATRDLDDPHSAWAIERGDAPLVATAIHDGHELRPEVQEKLALTEEERLREEDPLTGLFTTVAPTVVRAFRSRFEVDLNRPRERAVYRTPDDAWGLELWTEPLSDALVDRSLAVYDAFYGAMRSLFDDLAERWGRVVVYDIHSYNHRRRGRAEPPESLSRNPDVNVGTGTMDRDRWRPVVEAFEGALVGAEVRGRELDVRENVKFLGGHFGEWLHASYPTTVCVLSIELKKTFMNEWDGEANILAVEELRRALAATVPPVLAALKAE